MIGILCNQKDEDVLAMQIHSLLKSEILANHSSVVVFSLQNLDLNAGIVFGNTVSGQRIRQIETALPDVIFNLSVQYKSRHIKKLRELIGLQSIAIINASNKLNQGMIMDMLSSDAAARRFVLPYFRYSVYDPLCGIQGTGSLLIKPENKTGLNRITLTDTSFSGVDFSGAKGKKWLCIRVPELVKSGGLPVVVRVHLQRSPEGGWSILKKRVIPEEAEIDVRAAEKADAASLELIRLIHCFLPHLGLCYTDMIFDTGGNPYLLGFGGYDDGLLIGPDRDMQASLCRTMLGYARGFTNKPNGVLNYVD